MNQREFMYNFYKKTRPQFNQELFKRSDDELIDAVKNIIYSCQRESVFTIKVLDIQVIDDYDEINHILWEYEDSIINKTKSSKTKKETKKKPTKSKNKKLNIYEYINLKDTDMKLLQVDYYLRADNNNEKDEEKEGTLRVYIAIPRIVDGFYYRINGIMYSAMYQIVDASTYNNSASKNAKKQSITFKTEFTPLRVYKYTNTLKDHTGNLVPCTYFIINVFSKSTFLIKYFIAKMGLQGAINFMNIPGLFIYEYKELHNIDQDKNYIFPVKDKFIIVIDKVIYDSVLVAQSLVYTIHELIAGLKNPTITSIFEHKTWIEALGSDFTSKDIGHYEKGMSVLSSMSDFVYDISTREDLKLPLEDKDTVYHVLRWIMYEFNALRQKDNLDISTKKVRYAGYIAALYANKLSLGIFRVSDKGIKVTLKDLKKALKTAPMYLINAITKCQLVNYKNCANDLDSIVALKYTYKGISGIGEKSNAIPASYRNVHVSHLGRVDIDSSSNSDPGISGTLCPMANLYDNHFSIYQEPDTWRTELSKVIDAYNAMNSRVEMCRLVKDVDINCKKQNNNVVVNECIQINKKLLEVPLAINDQSQYINGYDIFGDGIMFYLNE